MRKVAPFKIAIDNGATKIYAIVLSLEEREPTEETYTFIVKTLLRTIELFVKEVTANDINRARLYNRVIDKVYMEYTLADFKSRIDDLVASRVFELWYTASVGRDVEVIEESFYVYAMGLAESVDRRATHEPNTSAFLCRIPHLLRPLRLSLADGARGTGTH